MRMYEFDIVVSIGSWSNGFLVLSILRAYRNEITSDREVYIQVYCLVNLVEADRIHSGYLNQEYHLYKANLGVLK